MLIIMKDRRRRYHDLYLHRIEMQCVWVREISRPFEQEARRSARHRSPATRRPARSRPAEFRMLSVSIERVGSSTRHFPSPSHTPITNWTLMPSAEPTALAPIPSAVLHRTVDHQPLFIASAKGSYLTTESGQKVLDGCGGAAVVSIGHGDRRIISALTKQMEQVSYLHCGAFANRVSF